MKVSDILNILKIEKITERTPLGRPLTEYAIESVMSALEDEKNLDTEAIQCLNCGLVLSGLLIPNGCPNCGGKARIELKARKGKRHCNICDTYFDKKEEKKCLTTP